MLHQPRTVVFDVIETLMSLEPLRTRFADVGLAPTLLEPLVGSVAARRHSLEAG